MTPLKMRQQAIQKIIFRHINYESKNISLLVFLFLYGVRLCEIFRTYMGRNLMRGLINGKRLYARIFIRKKVGA